MATTETSERPHVSMTQEPSNAKLEAALRESEERLRFALEGSNDGFWDWNIATGEVRFSRRWAEMLGYSPSELEPTVHTWERLMHPEDRPQVMAALTKHLEGLSPLYSTEHRLRTKQGDWRWVLDRGKVVARDENGRPLRAAGTHTDITDRKRAEQALTARDALLEAVGRCAETILQTKNWEADAFDVLHTLGAAACASRAYIFKNHVAANFELLSSLTHEWCAADVAPQMRNPDLQNLSWRARSTRSARPSSSWRRRWRTRPPSRSRICACASTCASSRSAIR
jgi:PAS domain S-box-containing protein